MDSKAVPPVRLLALENGVFTKAISIAKRNGYESLARAVDGSATLLSGAQQLARRDDELLALTVDRCFSHHRASDQWVDAGALIATSATDRAAVQTSSQQTGPDHATARGVTAYAWEDSRGGVWWTVEDAESGAVFRTPTQADAAGQRPRCVPVGDVIHIYYAVPSQTHIMVLVVNPSTPSAAVTPVLLVEDLNATNPAFDAVPTTRTGNVALLVWQEASAGNIRASYVTGAGELGRPLNGNPSSTFLPYVMTTDAPVACAFRYVDGGNGDRICVAFSSTDTTEKLAVLSGGTPGSFIGSTYIGATTVFASGLGQRVALTILDDDAWVVLERPYFATIDASCSMAAIDIDDLTVSTAERVQRGVGLASRAFTMGASTYAVFVHAATYFNTYLTLRLSDSFPAGRHLAASAFGLPVRAHLPSVHVSGSTATVTLPYLVRLASSENDKFTEAALRQVSISFEPERQTAQIGRGLYMAGGCPLHYDGRQWTEQGFHVGPERVTTAPAAGGSLTVSAVYLYKVWYEWTDNQGEIHRGPESAGTKVTMGGADTQVTLTLPTLRVTRKQNVRICVARSRPGDTAELFRVSSLDPTVSGPNGFVANDPTVDSVTFIDRMSDANLVKQERIYTTGGILSNDATTLGNTLAAGKNRIFFTDASAGSVVRFSQRIATGYGLEVAPEMAHDIDPAGGDVTAMAVMDDVVFVFKRSSIHAFNGDGPLENGSTANSGFSSSQLITTDVGCASARSLVLTPEGLMFQSAKGIYMLGRDRNINYVGAPVEAYNAQTVTSALVMPDRTQVVFLTASGKTLLFDYLFKQWSTFTNHEGLDAELVDNTYHYLRADSRVFRETLGAYTDAGARIPLRLETAWLHLTEHLQGFMRFWKLLLLGTWVSPHQLGISYRTDYGEAWSNPWWLDATGGTDPTGWLSGDDVNTVGEDPLLGSAYGDGVYGAGDYGGTPDDIYQWRFGIHENGQSVQFRFEDFEKSGLNGASFELTEMTLVGGIKKNHITPMSGSRST